ncbi:FAD-binding oxidoreductase [Leeia oryzae]|uniref:FAD-binding oxidoreductase n=1 Tax=Leeia oryzae TaxID=356662 RepID=UPI00037B0D16|nr:FAD-binding oxidoreductase [Leeia oryzae]
MPISATLLSQMHALGAQVVCTGDDIPVHYHTPYAEPAAPRPAALLRPTSVKMVADILRLCHQHGQAVVPQGGLTGLAAGAVPLGEEVVLSLEKLQGIEEIDPDASTITVLAGTPLEVVQQAAEAAGFTLGLDLGARGSCQIGGNIATNAGGNRAIRFGVMRDQVLGLEVVLADGTLVTSLNKMLKNNAGYDLKHLFIGSEGTLGIITRAVLKLHPRLAPPVTALCTVATDADVLAIWQQARRHLPGLISFEVMWPDFYAFMAKHTPGLTAPLAVTDSFYVLIECAVTDGSQDNDTVQHAMETQLERWMEAERVTDGVLAASTQQANTLWKIREGLPMDDLPHLINFDVSLPIGAIGAFAATCRQQLLARWPAAIALFFGHLGDSNLHIGISLNDPANAETAAVEALVYALVQQYQGTISAEHGIGVHKKPYLSLSRTPEELALMRLLKQTMDPKGILNPGKVL